MFVMETVLTPSLIRLRLFSQRDDLTPLVLIPGGPGMGTEYFTSLVKTVDWPVSIWLADLPGNGDNVVKQPDYDQWPHIIPEISNLLGKHTIYLGHSFGGMLLLTNPIIEKHCQALILMSALPETIFNEGGESYFEEPEVKNTLIVTSNRLQTKR